MKESNGSGCFTAIVFVITILIFVLITELDMSRICHINGYDHAVISRFDFDEGHVVWKCIHDTSYTVLPDGTITYLGENE